MAINSGGHQSSTQVLNDVKVIPYNAIKHLLSIKRGCLFQPLYTVTISCSHRSRITRSLNTRAPLFRAGVQSKGYFFLFGWPVNGSMVSNDVSWFATLSSYSDLKYIWLSFLDFYQLCLHNSPYTKISDAYVYA
ncbi:hypothetical protein SE071780_02088 [Streptococcus equi subsp. equi]|nr:hypothetical protein SE071780_02088 [Streptococcus equi subsp. equi]VEH35680.1 Uncharacterised protein [Streptococcus equi subsp. equi]